MSLCINEKGFEFYSLIKSKNEPNNDKGLDNYSPTIIINEINRSPEIDGSSLCWIELYNISDKAFDLTGWTIVNEKNNIVNLPRGLVIPPDEYLILTNNMFFF